MSERWQPTSSADLIFTSTPACNPTTHVLTLNEAADPVSDQHKLIAQRFPPLANESSRHSEQPTAHPSSLYLQLDIKNSLNYYLGRIVSGS